MIHSKGPVRLALPALLLVVAAFDLVGFDWGLPSRIAPHPDDVARPALSALRERFLAPTKYPKLHYLVLSAADAPYLAWLWATGDFHPEAVEGATKGEETLAHPLASYTALLRIARAVSVLFHLGTVALLFLTLMGLTGHRAGALACAAIFGLAPEVTLYARMSNVDGPMVFWIAAALFAYVRLLDRPTSRRLLALALVSAAAVGTKEQAAFALVGPVVHAAWLVYRQSGERLAMGLRAVLPAFLAGLLLWSLLAGLLQDPAGGIARLRWWRGELETFAEGFRRNPEFSTPARLAWGVFKRFLYTGGPGVALVSLAGLVLLGRHRQPLGSGLAALWILYPTITVATLGFVQARYLLPAVYLASLFAGLMIGRVWAAAPSGKHRGLLWVVLPALVLNAIHAGLIDRALVVEPRGKATAWLDAHAPEGKSVETYANANFLPCLEPAGLEAERCHDFTMEGFRNRRPPLVLVTDGFDWARTARQNAFIAWLQGGPAGYTTHRFGPAANHEPTFYLAPETRVRIWPDYTILERQAARTIPR